MKPSRLMGIVALLSVGVVYMLLQLLVTTGVGTASQTATYFLDASKRTGTFFGAVLEEGPDAWSKEAFKKGFELQTDQPPLARTVMALSWMGLGGRLGDWMAASVGIIVLGFFTLLVMVRAVTGTLGVSTGLLAGALLLVAPPFLHYCSAVGQEMAIAFAFTLFAFAVMRSTTSRTWGVLAGVALALAMAAHHQGVFLFVPALLYYATVNDRGRETPLEGAFRLPSIPVGILFVLVGGIALFWLAWPVLHGKGLEAFGDYVLWGFRQDHPPFAIGGEVFDQATGQAPPFGRIFGMLASRLPLAFLVPAVVGAAVVLYHTFAFRRTRPELRKLSIFVWVPLTSLVISGLNGSFWYNHTNLLVPLLPSMALLAAVGLVEVATILNETLRRVTLARRVWRIVLVVVLALPSVLAFARAMPDEWLYGSVLVGGTEGLVADQTTLITEPVLDDAAIDAINQHVPAKGSLLVGPNTGGYHRLVSSLVAAGILREDIVPKKRGTTTCVMVVYDPLDASYGAYVQMVSAMTPTAVVEVGGVEVYSLYCPSVETAKK